MIGLLGVAPSPLYEPALTRACSFSSLLQCLRNEHIRTVTCTHLTASAVSAYVTHGVFPKFSWQKFKADAGGASC